MLTTIVIAVPVFFIIAGAIAALSFSIPSEAEALATASQTADAGETNSLIFAQPALSAATVGSASTDQLVGQIETHLRQERKAAAEFVSNPSSRALWNK
jgi:hypothetical protein